MAGEKGGALVTGAARRIGRVIAEQLARAGYDLVLHTSERARAEAETCAAALRLSGCKVVVLTADLADAHAVAALAQQAFSAMPVTLLVNNASLFHADSAEAFEIDGWDRHFAVNLRAPAQLASAFVKALRPGASGVIVNIVDQRVWRLNPQFFSYTLTKAALWTATQTMAQAFAPRVRVNAVAPGPTLPNYQQDRADFLHEAEAVPLGRPIEPTEIAEAVLYLAEARAITGQMIAIDGGQHLAWRTRDLE